MENIEEKNIWFSSDYHLGHKNVIFYDKRPFKDVNHMDEMLIQNHNSVVQPDDDFYFLGDLSFNSRRTSEYLSRLNGNKFFIKGNHDSTKDTCKLYQKYGTYLGLLWEGTFANIPFTLCHYGMRVWRHSHRGAIHLYGHSHGSLPALNRSMDVGIMNTNYFPIHINDIFEKMQKIECKPIDHHGEHTN